MFFNAVTFAEIYELVKASGLDLGGLTPATFKIFYQCGQACQALGHDKLTLDQAIDWFAEPEAPSKYIGFTRATEVKHGEKLVVPRTGFAPVLFRPSI